MIWVPPGYSYGEAMFGLDEVRGGSGYGAGTFAGATGARQPSSVELGQAEHQVCLVLHYCRMRVMACVTKGDRVVECLCQPHVKVVTVFCGLSVDCTSETLVSASIYAHSCHLDSLGASFPCAKVAWSVSSYAHLLHWVLLACTGPWLH